MKKFFVSLLLCLSIVGAIPMLVACNPETQTPEPPPIEEKFTESVQAKIKSAIADAIIRVYTDDDWEQYANIEMTLGDSALTANVKLFEYADIYEDVENEVKAYFEEHSEYQVTINEQDPNLIFVIK